MNRSIILTMLHRVIPDMYNAVKRQILTDDGINPAERGRIASFGLRN